MIQHLDINNIGSLREFSNKESFPNRKIIIHGMNGSGKSQIASVFQNISKLRNAVESEQGQIDVIKNNVAEYLIKRKSKEINDNKSIDVKVDDFTLSVDIRTNQISYQGNFPKVFVFNDRYILDNVGDTVNLPDKTIKIGERNQERDELQKEIERAKKALKEVNKNITVLVTKVQKESGYSGQARTSKIISVENYLRSNNSGKKNENAKSQLEKLSNPPETITFHQASQFPRFSITEEEQNEIETIFSQPYIEPKLTKEFYSVYIKTNKKFYDVGVKLFEENKNQCPFCLSPKNNDDANISELINYINSTYNEKLESISNYYQKLKQYRETLTAFLSRWNSHVNIINEKAKLLGITQEISDLIFPSEKYQTILDYVQSKIQDMSIINSELDIEQSIPELFENLLTTFITKYNTHVEFIKVINESIDKIKGIKQKLGENIIKHHMYELWCKNALRDRKNELEKDIEQKEIRYSELSNAISNDRAIDFFNQIIKILGINKYELNDESSIILKIDDEYNISEEGFRISTGERKFIAMSYFFAEVLASVENNTDLKDITVIIDDPIDSSDYQKFYSFISVIENFDNILRTIYRNDEIELGQLFILTHNALLYERLINSQSVNAYYQLFQKDNKTTLFKPDSKVALTTFSSYLKKITNYIKNQDSDSKEIGNYIRRILEIVASIENVSNNKIENLNASSKLNALANHLSHESLERILDPLPETHEYNLACIELVEEIQRRIPKLYQTIKVKYLDDIEIEEYRRQYSDANL